MTLSLPPPFPVEGRDFWPFSPGAGVFSPVFPRGHETPRVCYLFIIYCRLIVILPNTPKMLGLCLYVPGSSSDSVEVEYFESDGLPLELKSLFNKLSVFLPSQELSTYQKWRKVL